MSQENIRRRIKNYAAQNGFAKLEEEKKDPEFVSRESVLTVLMENSLHIRAIYHIFVASLFVLFLNTVIYDFVESGKINIGLTVVVLGFGSIHRAAVIWIFLLVVALAFYPALRAYSIGDQYFRKSPVHIAWKAVGVVGLLLTEVTLIGAPTWILGKHSLPLGSSAIVTCEMFRFAMKVYTIAMVCKERCKNTAAQPTIGQYVYFLFAPTLLYRDQYPRTKTTRWNVVIYHLMEVVGVIFYNSFLWERFILPHWSNYGKEPKVEAGILVRGIFASVLPGIVSFLCGFYCLLHAWLNAFSEVLKFGDRLFYEEWWAQSQFSHYYRAWNRVVHSWLRDHIHRPLAPLAGRATSTFVVFFASALAHELILALSFGFFYPVMLIEFGVVGVLLLPLTAVSGRQHPFIFNFLMWLGFFFGNGLLWSLYSMEHFARTNCPPADSDSFFVPKSWSCPEVVLKPNWTFQNPFNVINY